MRNLIKKILREDFDWTSEAQAFELGSFEEDDISFDDKDAKVYLGDEGKVTYNISTDELVEYAYDGYEDWTLEALIRGNGDYDDEANEWYEYLDDYEINYIGHYLSQVQIERLQKILDHYDVKLVGSRGRRYTGVIDVIGDDNFSMLQEPMNKIYSGRHDWDDFVGESLSSLGRTINRNRWTTSGQHYLKVLSDNNVDITCYSYDDVRVEMSFPYKGNNNLSEAMADIGLDDVSWSDSFYEDWDTTGADEDIRHHFSFTLDRIEEQIDEETNS